MHIYDIIKKKRDGFELTYDEIHYVVMGFVENKIPDYQMSALLMAIYIRGMTERETADLTEIMAKSGDTVDLSIFGDTTVDKHSTGGVGDKTTLIVAPIAASLGCTVAKMSGRGLGHTGGTVDKLESFDGYDTSLSHDKFIKQVQKIGIAVVGQSGNLAPADKLIYALRDVTATIDCVPLIASSIMSKKIAAGAKSIVLDVKFGSGAFMKTYEEALVLARAMTDIGEKCGRRMCAVISDMDAPLGYAIGNALEIKEAIQVLKGEGPDDLKEICFALASEMVSLARGISGDEAMRLVENSVISGKAYDTFVKWITSQGGDPDYFTDLKKLPEAPNTYEVKAKASGYISKINTEVIGRACTILGAGRETKSDTIDLSAGIVMMRKLGSFLAEGDTILTLHTSDPSKFEEAANLVYSAFSISNTAPEIQPIVRNILR